MVRSKFRPVSRSRSDCPKIRTVSVDRAPSKVDYVVRYLMRAKSGVGLSARSIGELLEKINRCHAANIEIVDIWMVEEKRFPLTFDFEE